MAVNIEFTGFINGVRTFDWGNVYDMAHSQMMKDEQGEWKVAGKDYFSVTGPAGFEEGEQVTVTGTFKTKVYEKKDGTKGIALNVRAKDMQRKERSSGAKVSSAAINEVWPTIEIPSGVEDQAPF
tara:strand:- start:1208 stop:1582 length:375 start_codon:yes stop_codon:yes gene_type:complete